MSSPAPAAAAPFVDEEDDALPPEAAEPLAVLALGQEHEALGVFTEPLTVVSPTLPCTLVWSGQVHDALGRDEEALPPAAALPLALELPEAGDELEPDAAEGCELLADELELPPVAIWNCTRSAAT